MYSVAKGSVYDPALRIEDGAKIRTIHELWEAFVQAGAIQIFVTAINMIEVFKLISCITNFHLSGVLSYITSLLLLLLLLLLLSIVFDCYCCHQTRTQAETDTVFLTKVDQVACQVYISFVK